MTLDLKKYKNIAILNFRAIGDLICTMPLLKYCRREAPNAKITLLTKSVGTMLAPFLVDADEIIALPGKKTYCYSTFLKYGIKLRNSFDLVICANTPRKSANIFIWLLHPKNSVAYVKNNWHGKLIKTPLPFIAAKRKTRHCALETLNLVLPCDSISPDLMPSFTVNETIKQRYQKTLNIVKQLKKPVLLISVSNTKNFCDFATDNFADVLNTLAKTFTFSVIISYQKKDFLKAQDLSQKLESKNIVIETPELAEFITMLATVDLCFTGEGGIGHMAAALDKPQVILSSKTSLVEWAPLSSKAILLEHATHVNQISKNVVLNALQTILNNSGVKSRFGT